MRLTTARFLLLAAVGILAISAGCGTSPKVEEIHANLEAVTAAADLRASPGDWPWWRGLRQDGTSDDQPPPLEWSESQNIVWQAEVPGRGHASPIIVRQHRSLAT